MPVMRQFDVVQRRRSRYGVLGALGAIVASIARISRIHLGERSVPDCSAARHGSTFSELRPRMASGGP